MEHKKGVARGAGEGEAFRAVDDIGGVVWKSSGVLTLCAPPYARAIRGRRRGDHREREPEHQ
jgi:hypothetical protein